MRPIAPVLWLTSVCASLMWCAAPALPQAAAPDNAPVRICTEFAGATAGAKIAACVAGLPGTGGVADARGFGGDQVLDADLFGGAAKPVQLLLGSARFTMTAAQTLGPDASIRGLGEGATRLTYTGAGAAITVDAAGGSGRNVLEKFTLTTTSRSPALGPGTHGIRMRNANEISLRGIEIRGFASAGIHLSADPGEIVLNVAMDDLNVHENRDGILVTGGNTRVNHVSIVNSNVRANQGYNIHGIPDVRSWNVTGNNLEAGGLGSIRFNSVKGLQVSGNYFEQVTTASAIFLSAVPSERDGAMGILIAGNTIAGPGTGLAIRLGEPPSLVWGVDVRDNFFTGWNRAIEGTIRSGSLGPNSLTDGMVHVGSLGPETSGVLVHDAAGVASTGGFTVRDPLDSDRRLSLNVDRNGGYSGKAALQAELAESAPLPLQLNPRGGLVEVGPGGARIEGTADVRRLAASGPVLDRSDFRLDSRWGDRARIDNIRANDQRGSFTVTSAGSRQEANPTITITFKERWTDAPFAVVMKNGGSRRSSSEVSVRTSPTGLTITWHGTPAAAETLEFTFIVLG